MNPSQATMVFSYLLKEEEIQDYLESPEVIRLSMMDRCCHSILSCPTFWRRELSKKSGGKWTARDLDHLELRAIDLYRPVLGEQNMMWCRVYRRYYTNKSEHDSDIFGKEIAVFEKEQDAFAFPSHKISITKPNPIGFYRWFISKKGFPRCEKEKPRYFSLCGSTKYHPPMSTFYYRNRLGNIAKTRDHFYFEIQITKAPSMFIEEYCFVMGLTTHQDIELYEKEEMLPGWTNRSIGLHSDDGMIYHNNLPLDTVVRYRFSRGDVIGCGVDLEDQQCFFTKNGLCFQWVNIREMVTTSETFPVVVFDGDEWEFEVNFGQKPFLYRWEY